MKSTGRRDQVSGILARDDQMGVTNAYVRAFTDPSWMEAHMLRSLFCPPIYHPDHTRLIKINGCVASAVTMAPRAMGFASIKVPAMTIGPVGTDTHYRKRGYAAAVMNDACRYMRDQGILVAYLQGISDFYYRFGFFPYMASSTVGIQRKKAEGESLPGKLRSMKREHLPAVRSIYKRVSASRIGPAVRDRKVWSWLFESGVNTWLFRNPKVILDNRDRICGYLTYGFHDDPVHGEILVKPDELSCRSALGALARDAKRREKRDIILPLPWDDAFARFIRQHVSAQFRFFSNPTGGPLLKIVDFPALMKRLEPLFEERLRRAGMADRTSSCCIKSDLGSVRLLVSEGGVRIEDTSTAPRSAAVIPSRWLSGLMTGYYSIYDLKGRKGVAVPADTEVSLKVLFPSGWPFVYKGDNY